MSKISGTIINHNSVYDGEIDFDKTIKEIKKNKNNKVNNYIIPGFIDLHCHGGNGFDTMDGWNSIKKMSDYHVLT